MVDDTGAMVFRNRAFAETFGYAESEIVPLLEDLIAPQDQSMMRAIRKRSEARGRAIPWPATVRFLHRSGRLLHLVVTEWEAAIDGRGVLVQDVRDATVSVESGRRTREGESEVRTALDSAPIPMVLLTPKGRPRFRNRAYADLLGYTPTEIAELTFDQIATPESEAVADANAAAVFRGKDSDAVDLELLHKDGHTIEVELLISRVDREQDVTGFIASFRDVTGERAATRALAESEAHLRAVVDASQNGLSFAARDGSFFFRNQAHAEMLGYELQAMQEAPTADFVAPYEWDRQLAWYAPLRTNDLVVEPFSIDLVHRDGRIIHAVCQVSRVEIDGELVGWVTDTRDVTEELTVRRGLEASEAQLARGQEFAHVGTWSIELATGEQRWTDELYRLFGLVPGSIEPSQDAALQFIEPADRARLMKEAARSVESGDGGGVDEHVRTVGADGVARTLWIRSELTHDGDGHSLRWEGATQDVTDLLQTQGTLAEREEFLRSTLEAVQSGVLVFVDGRVVSANPQASDILGYSEAELTGRSAFELVSNDGGPQVRDRREALQRGELDAVVARYRAQRNDGAWIDLETRAAPMLHEGELRGSVVNIRDVTEELALQRAVEANAERLNTVFETVSTGLLVIGEDLRPITANTAACAILGYRHEELMQKTVPELGDPFGAKVLVSEMIESIEQGRRMEGLQTRAIRGDGVWIEIELTVEPFRIDGEVVGALCEIRDVTEKNAAERQLSRLHSEVEVRSHERRALVQQLLTAQEEERRTVAYEIHDGPAQQIAAAQMFLEAFAAEEGLSVVDQTYLRRGSAELTSALAEVRRIMSGLRPALLDDLGLSESLNQLLVELTNRAGVELELEVGSVGQLSPEIEISIYRIAQEAAGNALKHSQTPRLIVKLATEESTVALTVEDCGTGFDPQAVSGPREGRHYGLVGMLERATLLNGRLEIESVFGKGTRISVTIPLDGEQG